MKRIILATLIVFLGLMSFSQTSSTPYGVQLPEQDTSFNYIGDSVNVVLEDLKEIGDMVGTEYKKLGFVGFIRVYKYFIISIMIIVFLFILSARSKKE